MAAQISKNNYKKTTKIKRTTKTTKIKRPIQTAQNSNKNKKA